MAPIIENYPMIRQQIINKKDAQRLSVVYSPLMQTRELTIYWPVTDDNWMEQALYYLDTYACSDNNTPNRWYVDDPIASGEVYPGRWRVIQNRMSAKNEEPGVYQLLREGLLTSLPATEAADTEARLIKDDVDAQNGKRIVTRYWQGVDPLYEQTILANRLTTKSRTDVTVRGKTYTGTWAVSNVFGEPMEGDGAIRVVETLTQITSITTITDLQALTPLFNQENEILNLFGIQTGEGDYCTATYTNLNPASREVVMELSDANILTAATPTGDIAGTWTYADRKWVEGKDNTAQLIVLLKSMFWRSWATALAAGPTKLEYTEAGTERQGIKKYWLGVAKGDLAAAITALLSEVTVATETSPAEHHIRVVSATDNHDGSITLTRTEECKYQNVANTEATLVGSKPINPFALQKGTVAQLTSVYDGFDEAEIEAVSDTTPAGYTLVDSEIKPSGGYFFATFVYQLRTWATWGHDAYAYDTIEYTEAGTERQGVKKSWFGIRKADLSTAMTNLLSESTVAVVTDHHIRNVSVTDNHDGSLTFIRTEESKYQNAANTEATLVGSKPISPFALQSGAVAQLTSIYDGFTESEIEAVSDATPAGYTLINSETEPSGGYFKATFTYQLRTWKTWGSPSYAADLTTYDNAGTANEKELIHKIWFGIRKADLATAIANARAGTNVTPESGYIIYDAGVRDNQDGSITVTQSQKKQVNNVDVGIAATPGTIYNNPHGWDGGRVDIIETHYEHFTAAGLATAISGESAPSGYTLKSITPNLDGDGFYSQIYRYEKPTFSNTTGASPNKTAANFRTIAHINYDPDSDVAGIDRRIVKEAEGIPIADLAEIRDNQASESGFILNSVSINDNKDGSGTLRKDQTKLRATTDQYVSTWHAANGSQAESETIAWANLSISDIALILADAKTNSADMTAATYVAAPASHKLQSVVIRRNGNASGDVIRTTFIPRNGGGTDSWTSNYDNDYYFIVPKFRKVGSVKETRRILFHVFVRQTTSKANAYDWVNDSHNLIDINDGTFPAATTPSTTPVKAHVDHFGKNRYRSVAIFSSCTGWKMDNTPFTEDTTGRYKDVGAGTHP